MYQLTVQPTDRLTSCLIDQPDLPDPDPGRPHRALALTTAARGQKGGAGEGCWRGAGGLQKEDWVTMDCQDSGAQPLSLHHLQPAFFVLVVTTGFLSFPTVLSLSNLCSVCTLPPSPQVGLAGAMVVFLVEKCLLDQS